MGNLQWESSMGISLGISFDSMTNSQPTQKPRNMNLMESLSLESNSLDSNQNQSNQHRNQETLVIQWGI